MDRLSYPMDKRTENKIKYKYIGIQFLFWATVSAVSFEVVFLREEGFKNATIGTIMAVVAFARIFAQPLWGIVSDRVGSIKKIFMLCLASSALVFLLLPYFQGALWICLILTIFTFFSSPLTPLLDSWAMQRISSNQSLSYGSIRLWGSIGYALMTYVHGRLIDYKTVKITFPTYFILAIVTLLFSRKVENAVVTNHVTLKEMKFGKLFKNYHYVVFIFFALFLNIPTLASGVFLPNLVEQLGAGQELLGMMFAIRAMSEIPVFLLSGYLMKRFGAKKLLIFAGTMYILQQSVYLLATQPWHIIIGQMIGGSGYSLFLTSMISYIHMLTPDELKATGQTVATSFSTGFSAMIGSFIGGLTVDHLGLSWLYEISIANNILVVALFILSFPIGKYLDLKLKNKYP